MRNLEKMRNWKLSNETKTHCGVTLYRVELISDCKWGKKGDKGGWIERESNLSENAWVAGNAKITGHAKVLEEALVSDDAWVSGKAEVEDNAKVSGNALVSDNAWVFGNAKVSDNAWVFGNAKVTDNADIEDNARVFGNAKITGHAKVFGNAKVSGNAEVSKKVFTLNFGYNLTLTDNHIKYGCEQKTVEQWKQWLESDEEFETPRNEEKFRILEMSLRLAIEQHRQLNK